jgi:hypothetical protein
MALADWLLPLLLLSPDAGHSCELFEWGPAEPAIAPSAPLPATPAV